MAFGCPKIFMFMFAVNKDHYLKRGKNTGAHLSQNQEDIYLYSRVQTGCMWVYPHLIFVILLKGSVHLNFAQSPPRPNNKVLIKVYFMAIKP